MPGDAGRVYVVCRHWWARPDVVQFIGRDGWVGHLSRDEPVLLTAAAAVRRLEHALRHESAINYRHFVTTVDVIKRGRGDPI